MFFQPWRITRRPGPMSATGRSWSGSGWWSWPRSRPMRWRCCVQRWRGWGWRPSLPLPSSNAADTPLTRQQGPAQTWSLIYYWVYSYKYFTNPQTMWGLLFTVFVHLELLWVHLYVWTEGKLTHIHLKGMHTNKITIHITTPIQRKTVHLVGSNKKTSRKPLYKKKRHWWWSRRFWPIKVLVWVRHLWSC